MPLIVARPTVEEPTPPIEVPAPAVSLPVSVHWTAPGGTVLHLAGPESSTRLEILEGVDGLGAVPREITRNPLATGGAYNRWSHATERIITLPLAIEGEGREDFARLRREVTQAFTSTTPAAGMPRPGVLRITRPDATWRELSCVYLSGLQWTDGDGRGRYFDFVELELLAVDPWWYGEQVIAAEFAYADPVNYLNPYETVSPGATLGTSTIEVEGDTAVSPVWTITGPATDVTVEITDGPSWRFIDDLDAGDSVVIDVGAKTVVDQTGANRFGGLHWPQSELFELPPGPVEIGIQLLGGQPGPPPSSVRLEYRPRLETA